VERPQPGEVQADYEGNTVGVRIGHNVSTFEFVADAFGTATEWFANEPAPFDTPDFTIGERANINGTGAIRFMDNPSLVGQPNCYSPAVLTMDPHAAAGVGDHWFDLLAEGTNPTNGQQASPTCNGSAIGGLGIQAATKILYNAMLMEPLNAMYTDYRIWTLQAAKNLFINSCAAFSLNLASFVSGGTAPYHWFPSLIFLLPPGLTLNPNTGVVSGSPTTPGTYTFSFSVAESGGPLLRQLHVVGTGPRPPVPVTPASRATRASP
jgi:zinc metalloprotease ZmpA